MGYGCGQTGGGGINESAWETVFARRTVPTDPDDLSVVNTGIVYDRNYEYFVGTTITGDAGAISNPVIVGFALVSSGPSGQDGPMMEWKPSAAGSGITFGHGTKGAHLAALGVGSGPPSRTLARDLNSGLGIAGGEFWTEWRNTGSGYAYFVICRRKVTGVAA